MRPTRRATRRAASVAGALRESVREPGVWPSAPWVTRRVLWEMVCVASTSDSWWGWARRLIASPSPLSEALASALGTTPAGPRVERSAPSVPVLAVSRPALSGPPRTRRTLGPAAPEAVRTARSPPPNASTSARWATLRTVPSVHRAGRSGWGLSASPAGGRLCRRDRDRRRDERRRRHLVWCYDQLRGVPARLCRRQRLRRRGEHGTAWCGAGRVDPHDMQQRRKGRDVIVAAADLSTDGRPRPTARFFCSGRKQPGPYLVLPSRSTYRCLDGVTSESRHDGGKMGLRDMPQERPTLVWLHGLPRTAGNV